MNLLLDTHLWVWALTDDPKLSALARRRIEAADSVGFSVASLWELAIKQRLGKFKIDLALLRETSTRAGIIELPILGDAVLDTLTLPMLHKDQFDRLLIAQAKALDADFLTSDKTLRAYGHPVGIV